MLPDYSDITSRLGEPMWWDEYGVPRYEPFSPGWCDVFADYVAFMLIECQACGREFKVAVSAGKNDWQRLFLRRPVELPTAHSAGSFYYGDPPRHEEERCCAGNTMTSIPKRVLEFWHCTIDGNWHRLPEYEIEIEED